MLSVLLIRRSSSSSLILAIALALGSPAVEGAGDDPRLVTSDSPAFTAVEVGNGTAVVISDSPDGILVSNDLETWSIGITDTGVSLKSIAYGNGGFVGVSRHSILLSEDGLSWVTQIETEVELTDVYFVRGRYWALGWWTIFDSEDGKTWSRIDPSPGYYPVSSVPAPFRLVYDDGRGMHAFGSHRFYGHWLVSNYTPEYGFRWSAGSNDFFAGDVATDGVVLGALSVDRPQSDPLGARSVPLARDSEGVRRLSPPVAANSWIGVEYRGEKFHFFWENGIASTNSEFSEWDIDSFENSHRFVEVDQGETDWIAINHDSVFTRSYQAEPSSEWVRVYRKGATVTGARLVNLSVRFDIGMGAESLIVGFVSQGRAAADLLIRSVGPGLSGFGVEAPLEDPVLHLMGDGGEIAMDDNWSDKNVAQKETAFASAGAFDLAPGSLDAAVIESLPTGRYTVLIEGQGADEGTVLGEVFEVSGGRHLANLSCRAFLTGGESVVIAGVVVEGGDSAALLVRAVGPGLLVFGMDDRLMDPAVEVYRGDKRIASNSEWDDPDKMDLIETISESVGAFPMWRGSADAALVLDLEPGAYTAVVRSEQGLEGVVLLEFYLAE